jgi:molybdopterin/thiamine biosynthesis adenylyltransferase
LPKKHRISLKDYYLRQIVMRELGAEGQAKLHQSSVTIIGLGGLGATAAAYLTMAGVGKLRLVDQDTVETHNLQRQILYTIEDLRRPKVEAAADRLERVNPQVRLERIAENLREANADAMISGCDCVVDGLDNMSTRYVVNRACARNSVPYVFAGAIGMEGNISVFRPPATPCLECVMPDLDDRYLPTCETRGILGTTAGTIGALEAAETIKLLAGIQPLLEGKLLVCDLRELDFRTIDIQTRSSCRVCQLKEPTPAVAQESLTWLCGQSTINVNPARRLRINLASVPRKLGKGSKIHLRTPMAVVFQFDGYEVSLFNHGRMLIKGIDSEKKALEVYGRVLAKVGAKTWGR